MNELKRYREIINLTPHSIHIYENRADINPEIDKPIMTIEPSGVVTRVQAKTIRMARILVGDKNIPETITVHREVTNMPNPKPGTLYLVSYLVASSLSGRADLYCGANFVYNNRGQKVGIRTLGKAI